MVIQLRLIGLDNHLFELIFHSLTFTLQLTHSLTLSHKRKQFYMVHILYFPRNDEITVELVLRLGTNKGMY